MRTRAHRAERRRPTAGAVDVWRVRLGEADVATLSAAERARADRRRGDDRRRFAASHTAIRAIVAEYVGVMPAELRLAAPYGEKPRVAGAELELSLAHSGDLALVAVAGSPVGVDFEVVDDLPDDEIDDLAEFTLTERELAALAALEPHLRRRAFLRAWTRKEACLKAVGRGLGDRSLAEIDVGDEPYERIALTDEAITSVTVVDLEPAPGFVGAVALAADTVALALYDWDPPAAASGTVGKSDNVVS